MKPMNRRTLIRGAGGVAISLPFLEAMGPRSAFAQPAQAPKRMVVMVNQNGVVPRHWFPSGSGTDFQFNMSLTPFEPHKQNVIILDGVEKMHRGTTDGTAHGRGSAGAITGHTVSGRNGIADGPSIDQFVAERVGASTKFKSMLVGKVTNYHFFHSGSRRFVPPEDEPLKNFERVFADFTPPAGGAAPGPSTGEIEKTLTRRKSILDGALAEYRRIGGLVGTGDKARLDVHAETIRQIEKGLSAGTGMPAAATMSCAKPENPGAVMGYDKRGELNIKLLGLALACDLTRVGGIQWTSHNTVFSWLGINESDHHPLAHQTGNTGADDKLGMIVQWHAQQLANLVAQLKSYGEGAGSVFDNTLMLWTNEISIGSHRFNRGPFLLAAGKFPLPGGKILETGRVIKANNHPHTGVLIAMAQAMGLEVDRFGAGAWQRGPVPGLL